MDAALQCVKLDGGENTEIVDLLRQHGGVASEKPAGGTSPRRRGPADRVKERAAGVGTIKMIGNDFVMGGRTLSRKR